MGDETFTEKGRGSPAGPRVSLADLDALYARLQELEAQLAASQADVAALRSALKNCLGACDAMADEGILAEGSYEFIRQALASPSPGEKIMAVVEAAELLRDASSDRDEDTLVHGYIVSAQEWIWFCEVLDTLGEG